MDLTPPLASLPRLWVVPENDGESVEIVRLLRDQNEDHLVSRQPWGASWAALEPAVAASVAAWRSAHPGGIIYGVELEGANPWDARDIDHHCYSSGDRTHPLSSLEQVASLLGLTLTRRQHLAALNDRGYIPALLAAGATPGEIAAIRQQDRMAQGLTPAHEEQAARDVAGAEWRGMRARVVCSAGVTAAHADSLFGRASEVLFTSPAEWSYEGPRHRALAALVREHGFRERHWSGGAPEHGYFGIAQPSEAVRSAILDFFWNP